MEPETEPIRPHRRRRFIIIGIILVVIASAAIKFWPKHKPPHVTNFTECVTAGYPVEESYPQICRVPGGASFSSDAGSTVASEPKTNLVFDTLVISKGGPVKSSTAVVHNQAEWQTFWATTHAHITPLPPILAVDFTKEMVAAVMMGQKTTTGYRLQITNIYEVAAKVIVEAKETKPPKGCVPAPTVVAPYHIVKFPKSAKPVVFDIQTSDDISSCGTNVGSDPDAPGQVSPY